MVKGGQDLSVTYHFHEPSMSGEMETPSTLPISCSSWCDVTGIIGREKVMITWLLGVFSSPSGEYRSTLWTITTFRSDSVLLHGADRRST